MANIIHRSCPEPTSATRTASTAVLLKHLSEHKIPLISVRNTVVVHTPLHLTDHSLPLVNCFLSMIWICPVLAKLSTALTPALISLLPLSQHPVCLESHMTSICLLCQSNLSKICSDHSPDQHFAIFPNSHGREFSNCQTSQSDIPGPTSRESYLRQDGVIAPRIYIFNKLVRWFRCVRTLPSSLNCSLSSGISWPSLLPLTSANAPMSPLNYPSLSMSG